MGKLSMSTETNRATWVLGRTVAGLLFEEVVIAVVEVVGEVVRVLTQRCDDRTLVGNHDILF